MDTDILRDCIYNYLAISGELNIMNNNIYFKISRNQMNRALTVLNDALKKLMNEQLNHDVHNHSPEFLQREWKEYDKKMETLKHYLEVANFSIKQTKLKEFFIDYEFARVLKTVLFTEEK